MKCPTTILYLLPPLQNHRFSSLDLKSVFSRSRIYFKYFFLHFLYDFISIFQSKQKALSERGDLGTLVADPSLNEQYIEPESGEIKPIFTYKEEAGNIFVRCEICQLQAVGKYNLDTHRGGKKHRANIEKYESIQNNIGKIGNFVNMILKHIVDYQEIQNKMKIQRKAQKIQKMQSF